MKRIDTSVLDNYINELLGQNLFINGKLLMKGTRLSSVDIKSIKDNIDIYPYIILDTKDSINIKIENIIPEVIQIETEKSLDKIFNSSLFNFEKENISDFIEVTYIIMEKILNKEEVMKYLSLLFEYGGRLVTHSINVAVYSTLLAIKLGLCRESLENIIIGALLHDIGKVELFNKYPYLLKRDLVVNKEVLEKIQEHVILGYYTLEKSTLPTSVKKIVLLHHVWENSDLSFDESNNINKSYPIEFLKRKITSKDKDICVGIVQVANIFESRINKIKWEKYEIQKILDFIRESTGIQFNKSGSVLSNFLTFYDESINQNVYIKNTSFSQLNELSNKIIRFKPGYFRGLEMNLSMSFPNVILEEVI